MRKSQTKSGPRSVKVVAVAVAAGAAVLAAPALPAFAATSISTTQVSTTGSTVYITGGTGMSSSMGVRFAVATNSCPAAYDTAQSGSIAHGNSGAAYAVGSSTTSVAVQTPSTLVPGTA